MSNSTESENDIVTQADKDLLRSVSSITRDETQDWSAEERAVAKYRIQAEEHRLECRAGEDQ
jgi:hypothetical protein